MDPSTIVVIVGIATLLIERIFTWSTRIKHSTCCGCDLEMESKNEKDKLIN